MAGIQEIKEKNFVYLMLSLYKSNWRSNFPRDMGLPLEYCENIMRRWGEVVAKKIDKDRVELMKLNADEVPTANKIIDNAMKKIEKTIATCEDPSKIARTIQILDELSKESESIKREKKSSILDKYKKNKQNETS